MEGEREEEEWVVPSSQEAKRSINMIRQAVERTFLGALDDRDESKDLVSLSIGDPAIFGNLPPHQEVREAVSRAALAGHNEGYAHSCGLETAQAAVAHEFSEPTAPLTPKDVVMANAISGALEMSTTVLSNPGQNILVPRPGFAVYRCHIESRGVEARYYRLRPEASWEIDLEDLERQIDGATAAILVTNPSNPCGSVFSAQHIRDILSVARRHRLPIVADETYAKMVFRGQHFHSVASLCADVPVLTCGGISKRFMVPGWRLGWILVHNRRNAFTKEVIPGLQQLAQKLLGPCTLIQTALPDILTRVPDSYHQRNLDLFETSARLCYERLSPIPGLTPIMPAGAMYMMVMLDLPHFPEFPDDTAFAKQLLLEQSVFCLPGEAFKSESCIRLVLIMPVEQIEVACARMQEFCSRHYQA